MRKGLDKREVESLAKTMEVKFTVSGPAIGGAKSGINFDPQDPRKRGVLERYGVELIGADVEAIQRGEDRLKFKEIVQSIGGDVPRSAVCHTMAEVREAVVELGLPVVIRPSFTMGGLGSGMAHTDADLDRLAGTGLAAIG